MAELPEVETMRRDLELEVMGKRIERADIAQIRMLGGQRPEELRSRLEGVRFGAIARRGKYLFLHLASASGNLDVASGDALLIHRGMTGNLFLKQPDETYDPHLHLALTLDDGRQLRLHDHRGFGELRAVTSAELTVLSDRLGPEPLGLAFTVDYLVEQLSRRTALVKALLLNQAIVAGLGNIYVDEALWAAQVHPERRAHTLCQIEIEALQKAIVRLLADSVERRGTTFSDYKDLYGRPGGNSSHLQVFHQTNNPCPRCGALITKIRAAGRGSSVCLACQVAPPKPELLATIPS